MSSLDIGQVVQTVYSNIKCRGVKEEARSGQSYTGSVLIHEAHCRSCEYSAPKYREIMSRKDLDALGSQRESLCANPLLMAVSKGVLQKSRLT